MCLFFVLVVDVAAIIGCGGGGGGGGGSCGGDTNDYKSCVKHISLSLKVQTERWRNCFCAYRIQHRRQTDSK
jgi:hypothetical protein